MDAFEYKVLWNKRTGVIAEHWFDEEHDLGSDITTELLTRYGQDGWEVVATMQFMGGGTHKVILKRHRPSREPT